MKKAFILIFIILIFTSFSLDVCAASQDEKISIDDIIDNQLKKANISDLQDNIQQLKLDEAGIDETQNIGKLIKDIATGRHRLNIKSILNNILNIFFAGINTNLKLMLQIVVLSIICAIFNNFQSSFINSDVSRIAFYASYILIIIIIIKSFVLTIDICKNTITNMVSFMEVLTPLLLAFLASIGGITTSAVFHPAIALMVTFIGTFLKNVLLPLIFFSAVLFLIDNISSRIHVSRLASLLNNICIWSLGIIFTVFVGLMTIQGVSSTTFDGISIRTAKYAVDTFVPIIGGMFSDSVDAIIGCSLLIKNAIGVVGLIIILSICIVPLIKIASIILIYKITSALVQTINVDELSKCINDVGNSAVLLFLTVVSVSLMFFITITIIIGAGNIAMMMR
ncbi:MAG: stage III sporulation protein AE [Clostridia bacterium]|nr:stage III sporulation protein AE [Clostridia bacterium]